jgi:hypothetical protein
MGDEDEELTWRQKMMTLRAVAKEKSISIINL